VTARGRERLRTAVYSLALLVVFLGLWQALSSAGGSASGKAQGIPGPVAVARTAVQMLADPFYDPAPTTRASGSSSRPASAG
jgi:ABC-type nitrate/sulfonate/bicarbonate transport system permease component